ncbi:family 16 glycosylhydrolase [Mastigocoleus testarum]|uniref:GH16 domain-containing protein n=1 Tax=Mastigocoleus testarum BC008 TaxID=371196 RepID=A0A0V7ZTA3_9CYAN|nr:family 16 glycosylhydrolase [Mastigocoleus testarum]KST67691.1 hypothetical protein BC008_43830 [Mastigocoleus testarum BC008]
MYKSIFQSRTKKFFVIFASVIFALRLIAGILNADVGLAQANGYVDASIDMTKQTFNGVNTSSSSGGKKGLPPAPSGMMWQGIDSLSDEFNGNSLDPNKWINYHPYWNGRPPSKFKRENVSVGGGNLRLKSTSRINSLSQVRNPEKDIWVDSAAVASKDPSASYGYYEARIKASQLSMTSAFWFQAPRSGEIDVQENIGASTKHPNWLNNLMRMNSHTWKGSWDNNLNTPKQYRMPYGAAEDYHVYGVWWKDARTLWFYHNGKKVAEVQTGGPFYDPQYMFFDTEVFTFDGLPTISSLKDDTKNTMLVDWVRSYELVPDDGSGSQTPNSNGQLKLQSKNSYTFEVDYKAEQQRDIVVEIWNSKKWLGEGKATVSGGSGSALVTVNLPSAPTPGNGYMVKASMRPVGTNWQQNIKLVQFGDIEVL